MRTWKWSRCKKIRPGKALVKLPAAASSTGTEQRCLFTQSSHVELWAQPPLWGGVPYKTIGLDLSAICFISSPSFLTYKYDCLILCLVTPLFSSALLSLLYLLIRWFNVHGLYTHSVCICLYLFIFGLRSLNLIHMHHIY